MRLSLRPTSRIVAAIAATLFLPGLLWAHARLVSSDPARGAVLEHSPAQVRLVFSEIPEIALASVRLVHGADTIALTPIASDGSDDHVIIAPVSSALSSGSYRILWRIASRDGHPIRGSIDFTVRDTGTMLSTSIEPAAPATQLSDSPESTSIAVGGAFSSIVVRWLGFAGLFALIGCVVFKFLIVRRISGSDADPFVEIASTNAATLGLVSTAALTLSVLLKLARESSDMPDIPMSSMLLGSTWGASLMVQLLASIVAAVAFRMAHGRSTQVRETGWLVAGSAAALAGMAQSFSGHAMGGDRAWLAVPADMVHVLASASWLGTLTVIVIVGISAALKNPDATRPGARVARLINVFSPVALLCAGAVVATGVGSSVLRVPRVDALWTTPYGVVLVLKLFFVALLFAAGAWNWRRMKPRLTGDDAIAPLRSSASLELLLAATVLGITAVLVALELP